jgi:hypothetical protein
MRLSQLARKLEISPTQLILFFEKNKIERYNSHNNKIEKSDLKLALNHFNPEEMEAEIESQVIQAKESEIDTPQKKGKEKSASGLIVSNKPDKETTDPDPPFEEEDEIEVISMPKIKLEGVKVVGKIDLPEPVKKVKDENNSRDQKENKLSDNISEEGHRKEHHKNREKPFRQKNRKKHTTKELSYEEKLKREERRRIREQQRAKKLKKEQKKLHYIKNVQSNVSPSRKKKKSSKAEQSEMESIKVKPEYKNPVRKFWAWLNGEYD